MTMITALRLQASLDDSLGTPWGTGDLRHKLQTCDCGHWCWCNVAKLEISFIYIYINWKSMKDLLANKYVVQQCNTNPRNLKPILWFDTKRHFLGWNYLFWTVRLKRPNMKTPELHVGRQSVQYPFFPSSTSSTCWDLQPFIPGCLRNLGGMGNLDWPKKNREEPEEPAYYSFRNSK